MSDEHDTDRACPACGIPLDLDVESCEQHERHRLGGDPTVAGGPERRRRRRRDDEPFTRGDFRRWKNQRAVPAFVALTLIATLAGYLGYNAGTDSSNGLKANSAQAAYDTCISGGELRIAVARGLDDLRSLAITSDVRGSVKKEFTLRTQPAIDRLLSQAAGREFHAPQPPGTVTDAVVLQVRTLSVLRCTKRASTAFGDQTVTN